MNPLLLGVAYYPEHDPESEWERDADLMAELGINCIRIGEFCWSRMQQCDGAFTLDWIERVIELFATRGIRTILCTPTATPPVWLVERYGDLACIAPDGRTGSFGGRRHYSVFHDGYRADCRAIAAAMAQRFGRHPAIAGWQIDNEVGSYFTVDCSPPALRAFHGHLAAKYGTVAEMNRRWGLIFWNQEVMRFDQVPAPTHMMCTRNPSYLLEYNRFCLEGLARFVLEQAEVMRPHVTQFIVACAVEAVLAEVARLQQARGVRWVDEVTLHNYPELSAVPGGAAMMLDRFRGLSHAQGYLALEHQVGSGHTTTGGLNPAIRRFWSLETLAHGARAILWFHWRRFRTGCEWRLASVVERDRRKRQPFVTLQGIIRECQKVAPYLAQARVKADVQVLISLDNILARDRASDPIFWMEIQLPEALANRWPQWEREVRRVIYNPLVQLGLTVDFVMETDDWDPHLPLLIPDLDICAPRLVQKVTTFCERGGWLLCFPGAGERDEHGAHREAPPPGILAPLFGVTLRDYYPLEADCGVAFDPMRGQPVANVAETPPVTRVTVDVEGMAIPFDIRHGEILELDGAAGIGFLREGPCRGLPVIARRKAGAGQAIYLGAVPADTEAALRFYQQILPAVQGRPAVPYQVIQLVSPAGRFRFLLNGTNLACSLGGTVHDLLRDKDMDELPPWGVAFLKE